jgi:hypothetical protein
MGIWRDCAIAHLPVERKRESLANFFLRGKESRIAAFASSRNDPLSWMMRPSVTYPMSKAISFTARTLLLLATLGVVASAIAAEARPVLLYSRYFNAKGETRYLPAGTYKDVLDRLRADFEVRVHDQPLQAASLGGVAVVLIANPSDQAVGANPRPPHCSADDVVELTRFVRDSGGLIVMGNQENHNLEITDFNALLAAFGMRFENLYTDAKKIALPPTTPVIGGLRWAYYTGNLVRLQPDHPAKPRALVTNDLSQKPEKGARDQSGVLMAAAEPGKGRVIVVTDSGWISNDALSGKGIGDVAIKEHDNWEIFRRLMRWIAHQR